jgi:nucleoside-diphosphate-sugar epimerase
VRTFVTGATGFVGSHLVDALLAAGDEVTALVRSPAKAAGLAARGVRLVQGDLHDAAALRRGVEGADAVQHVAALVGAVDEAEFLRANRDGTRHVVEAVRDAAPGARLVLTSSLAAAGPAERGAPRTVEAPERPVTMYGRSKLASEQVVRESGLDWVIARPPAVYGPRDQDNFLTLFKIARWGVCPVFGDGTQELSLVYAPDLAEGLRLAGATPGLGGRAYFVNHPEIVTSGDVVRQIGRVTGREVQLLPVPRALAELALGVAGGTASLLKRKTILRADKAHEFFQPAWTGDAAPFLRDTGWVPRHALVPGLEATWAWYRERGLA